MPFQRVRCVRPTTPSAECRGRRVRFGKSGVRRTPPEHEALAQRVRPEPIGSVDAARTWRGVKMAGQMGNIHTTTRGLTVVKVDVERNLLMIGGAVPGAKNSIVTVTGSL